MGKLSDGWNNTHTKKKRRPLEMAEGRFHLKALFDNTEKKISASSNKNNAFQTVLWFSNVSLENVFMSILTE